MDKEEARAIFEQALTDHRNWVADGGRPSESGRFVWNELRDKHGWTDNQFWYSPFPPNALLHRADLCNINLSDVHLEGLDLRGATIQNAIFRGSVFKDCPIHDVEVCDTSFSYSVWSKTSARASVFRRCEFLNSHFESSDFSYCRFPMSDLTGVGDVGGLFSCEHPRDCACWDTGWMGGIRLGESRR